MGSIGEDYAEWKRLALERDLEVSRLTTRAEQAERERAATEEDLAAVRQSAEFFDRAANEERKRAERAERERDEARAGEAAAFVAGKAEAREEVERAEADNAALLEAYRRTWGCVMHDNVLHSPACNASDDALGICTPECPALYVSDLLKAEHPGVALLERVRALEEVVASFAEKEWARGDWQGFCPFRRHKDVACLGTDGKVSAVGTPSPVPHAKHCPYHLLHALEPKR